MAENTNKLILLVVAAVALLLTLNIYQKQVGKNLAVVLSIVTIVVVGYVGFTLMNNGSALNNANNVNLENNLLPSNNNALANNLLASNNNALANNLLAENNNVLANNAMENNVNAVEGFKGNMPPKMKQMMKQMPPKAKQRMEKMMEKRMKHIKEGFQNRRRRNNSNDDNDNDNVENFQVSNNNANNANNSSVNNVQVNSVQENSQNSPASSGTLNCSDLLPGDSNSTWAQVSPSGVGELCTKNLLNAGHHIGVNTQGCSLRNANRGLRSEPPNPQTQVSPWLQTTICPDMLRKPLE